MKPIYLVAKYVRDVMRMEPKNFGVILWHAGQFSLKFHGANIIDDKVSCDERKLHRIIGSPGTYIQWIEYWNELLQSFTPQTTDEEVIAALIRTNKNSGNYWMVNGGYLLDDVENVDVAADYLYRILVEKINYSSSSDSKQKNKEKEEKFDSKCIGLLNESGLTNIKGFRSNEEIVCDLLKDVKVSFKFSHSLYNGKLRSVIEKVPYTNKESRLQQHVHDTAYKMEKLLSNGTINKENAVIFYEDRELYTSTPKGKELLSIMEYTGNPVDVSIPEKALGVLSRIKKEISSHN